MALTSESKLSVGSSQAGRNGASRADRAAILRILASARLLSPLAVLAVSILLGLLMALLLYLDVGDGPTLILLCLVLGISGLLGFGIGAARAVSLLLKPLVSLQASVAQVCQGEPGASLPMAHSGVLGALARDIDSLSEELTGLYEDMDDRVARQTVRLAQKTASLKILYDVAASINSAQDLEQLLIRFLRVLKEMVNGRTAKVRLVTVEGRMRIVGCIGLDDEVVREQRLLPVPVCRCGMVLTPADILCAHDAEHCSRSNNRQMFDERAIEKVRVPLEYQDKLLGVYDIFVPKPGISGREDILELLSTIGSHLGMAVAKQRSDAEARRLSIIEERNNLAHELHDSLAQTLASLRFQVGMLAETLEQSEEVKGARSELERLRNGLDEAHIELRGLLNSFRAPLDRRGLIPALEKLVNGFRQETGIATFMQRDCRHPIQMNANEEMQMLRIVQEALANIRKHARAHTVRVLLRCREPGQYMLLVEDDGLGLEGSVRDGNPGEHIGLSIMEERARRLGAELRIESEPGEGTRVELVFRAGERLRDTLP
jgi:two-component system nitrate/nitrite sensor histidine kinase NarX